MAEFDVSVEADLDLSASPALGQVFDASVFTGLGISSPMSHSREINLSVSAGLGFASSPYNGRPFDLSVSAGLRVQSTLPLDLGRFRHGDAIGLVFAAPSPPSIAPMALIDSPSGSPMASLPLWTRDGGMTFRATLLPDQGYGVGRYTVGVMLTYGGGASILLRQQFEIVAGGDPAGGIIAIHEHEGDAGRAVIVQTSSGRLLEGDGPWA